MPSSLLWLLSPVAENFVFPGLNLASQPAQLVSNTRVGWMLFRRVFKHLCRFVHLTKIDHDHCQIIVSH